MSVPHWTVCYLINTAAEREITLREIERQAGLGQNTVTRWKTTGRTPRLDEIDRALNVVGLRMSISTLYEG